MIPSRRYVLGGVFIALLLVTAALLADVIATVFLAVTVAYLLAPVPPRLRDRGLSRRSASVLTTAGAFVATLALFSPLAIILLLGLDQLVVVLSSMPDQITIEGFDIAYVLTTEEVLATLTTTLQHGARRAVSATPVLLAKLALFVFLVFSLLYHQGKTRSATLAVVPPSYRSVAQALHDRARETLFALYVLQAATAAGTFLIAAPLFMLFGYSVPITLATLAALLQFLPVVGPSVLLLGLAAWHAIAGPLSVALVVEMASLLSAELDQVPVSD